MVLRLNQWFLTACCLALFAGPASAQTPGGKGGGATAEPSVKYTIAWLGNPFNFVDYSSGNYYPFDMNNDGHVVGRVFHPNGATRNSAFVVYSAQAGMIDVNSFPAMAEWSSQGWTAVSADGINDSGQMAVRMEKTVNGMVIKGMFRYDPPTLTLAGQFELIQGVGVCSGSAINNWGDIAFGSDDLGGGNCSWRLHTTEGGVSTPLIGGSPISGTVMDLNDFRQIVGTQIVGPSGSLVRYDALDPSKSLVLGRTHSDKGGINTKGEVAFTLAVPKGKGFDSKPTRYDGVGLQILRDTGMATDINSEGDVCGRDGNGVALLVFPRQGGTVVVDSEVTGFLADVNKWKSVLNFQSALINDRDSTGFGQLCGEAWVPNGNGSFRSELYLLTPTN